MILTNVLCLDWTSELLIYVGAIFSVLHNNYQAGTFIILTLQMRRLRHKIPKLVMAEPEPEHGHQVTSAGETLKVAESLQTGLGGLNHSLNILDKQTLFLKVFPPIMWASLVKILLPSFT